MGLEVILGQGMLLHSLSMYTDEVPRIRTQQVIPMSVAPEYLVET
jgi:hypothetical protein